MSVPFELGKGQRIFSILVQCLCQTLVDGLGEKNSDLFYPWIEAFIMRPSAPGTTDFQIIEETRTRAFLVKESPSKDMQILSYRWGINDSLVSSFQDEDLLVLEAKVPIQGNRLVVGWVAGEICVSSTES